MRTAMGVLAAVVLVALAAPAAASTRVVVPERFYDVALDGDSIVYATDSERSEALVRHNFATGPREELFRTRHDINGLILEPDGRIVFGVESARSSSVRELRTDGSMRVVARQGQGRCDGPVSPAGTGPGGVVYTMAEAGPCTGRRITLVLRAHAADGRVEELRRITRRDVDDLLSLSLMFVLNEHLLTWDLFARMRVAPLAGGPATILRDGPRSFHLPLDISATGRLLVLVVRSLDPAGERVSVRIRLDQVGAEGPGRTIDFHRDQLMIGAFCGERIVSWRRARTGQVVRLLDSDGLEELSRQAGPRVPDEMPSFACDADRLVIASARRRSTVVDVFDLP